MVVATGNAVISSSGSAGPALVFVTCVLGIPVGLKWPRGTLAVTSALLGALVAVAAVDIYGGGVFYRAAVM